MPSIKIPKIYIAALVITFISVPALAVQIVSVTTCESVAEQDLIPVNIRDSFTPATAEIHAVVKIDDAVPGTIIRCAWVAIDAIATPNYEIDATESECYRQGPATAHFSITRPDQGWPPGDYKLNIYLDGNLATVKTFSIIASTEPAANEPPRKAQLPPAQPHVPSPATAPTTGYGQSGSYTMTSGGVTLILNLVHNPSGDLTGTLTGSSGIQYTIEGMVEEGVGYGACYDNQGGVFFESYLAEDQLYFALVEPDANNMPDYSRMQEFTFTRVTAKATAPPPMSRTATPAPSQPAPGSSPPAGSAGLPNISGSAPVAPGTAAASPGSAGRAGKTYRHPVGFSFWYPDSWSANMQEGFLQLIPASPGKTAAGPTELYFVAGESVAADGITSPDDPRVVSYLDEQVRSLAPVLQYTGRSTPVNMAHGRGAYLEWTGTGKGGEKLEARVFVSIIRDHGVALLGVGHRERLDARDADLRQMFATFGFGEGQNDPGLVGSWELVSTVAITNQSVWETDWSRAQAVSETSSWFTFQPDGTCLRRDKSQTLIGSSGIWLEDNSDKTSRGKWNGGDGLLYIVWEDNTYTECQYRFEPSNYGRQLKLIMGGKGEIWKPAQ